MTCQAVTRILILNSRTKLRSQTSDSWTDAATVVRTVIEKKETEEKESEENAEKRKRQKKENEGARKVEKCEGHLDVKKLKAPHLQSNLGG